MDGRNFAEIKEIINEDDFSPESKEKWTFNIINDLNDNNESIDVVSVFDEFCKRRSFSRYKNAHWLIETIKRTPTIIDGLEYARQLSVMKENTHEEEQFSTVEKDRVCVSKESGLQQSSEVKKHINNDIRLIELCEIESAFLSLVISGDTEPQKELDSAFESVRAENFVSPINRLIYMTIERIKYQNRKIDEDSIIAELYKFNQIKKIGGERVRLDLIGTMEIAFEIEKHPYDFDMGNAAHYAKEMQTHHDDNYQSVIKENDLVARKERMEQAILVCLVYDKKIFRKLKKIITPNDFSNPINRRMFDMFMERRKNHEELGLEEAYRFEEKYESFDFADATSELFGMMLGSNEAVEYAQELVKLNKH